MAIIGNSQDSEDHKSSPTHPSQKTRVNPEQITNIKISQKNTHLLTKIVVSLLKENAKQNQNLRKRQISCNSFFFQNKISVQKFSWKLSKMIHMYHLQDSMLEVTIVYIDRILTHWTFKKEINVKALMVASALVASKYLADFNVFNADVAQLFDIPLETMNCLEKEILNLLLFSLYVKTEEFQRTKALTKNLLKNFCLM